MIVKCIECLEHQNQVIHMLIKGASEDMHCTSALRDFSHLILLKHSFSYLNNFVDLHWQSSYVNVSLCVPCT